jgi:hypothetical protein
MLLLNDADIKSMNGSCDAATPYVAEGDMLNDGGIIPLTVVSVDGAAPWIVDVDDEGAIPVMYGGKAPCDWRNDVGV